MSDLWRGFIRMATWGVLVALSVWACQTIIWRMGVLGLVVAALYGLDQLAEWWG